MSARDVRAALNAERIKACGKTLLSAAKAAQRRVERRPQYLPTRLPSFWDEHLRVWVQCHIHGELCIYERSGRRRGKLIARSIKGDWFVLDTDSVAPLDVAPRLM
jgi:hypothetical protein